MYDIKKSNVSKKINNEFRNYCESIFGYGLHRIEGSLIRSSMINFFKTNKFIELYREYFIEIINNNNLSQSEYCLQDQPTPRVFEPNAHGTSIHCDYWYGHGEETFTIWTPLTIVDQNNTFLICNEEKNESLHSLFASSKKIDDAVMDFFQKNCFPALPKIDEYVIFDSMVMHASSLNASKNRRISFDFRISKKLDKSCTKELENYLVVSGDALVPIAGKSDYKCLKYICGGINKSTYLQHIIIENYADINKHKIVAQEAEIERYGHPMLYQYLQDLYIKKDIDVILIASESMVDESFKKYIESTKVKIIYCLEKKIVHPRK